MATTFDEVLLDTAYSAEAEGGPEFATVIIRSGEGGAVAQRNQNREDFVSRYQIEYGLLSPARRKALRTFAILREGMSRGFRFLAPDDNTLEDEYVGWLNPSTGKIEPKFDTDGETTDFYLISYLTDQANAYVRRIVKPSPFEDFKINFYDSVNTTELLDEVVFDAGTGVGPFGVINETMQTLMIGVTDVIVNLHQGKITIAPALPQGYQIRVSCTYHVPVAFSQDWQKFAIDDAGLSSFQIGLEEILPVELGIT
jgi:uncharacterized protein (TIGR02217 family)